MTATQVAALMRAKQLTMEQVKMAILLLPEHRLTAENLAVLFNVNPKAIWRRLKRLRDTFGIKRNCHFVKLLRPKLLPDETALQSNKDWPAVATLVRDMSVQKDWYAPKKMKPFTKPPTPEDMSRAILSMELPYNQRQLSRVLGCSQPVLSGADGWLQKTYGTRHLHTIRRHLEASRGVKSVDQPTEAGL